MQPKLTDAEIDELVIAQTDDDSAWEEPIQVVREQETSLTLPADLAKRATFLARLHREQNFESWLTRIIQERVELEEGAFLQAERELANARWRLAQPLFLSSQPVQGRALPPQDGLLL